MPKRKTGARKKAEKQKEHQASRIRAGNYDLLQLPCNLPMVCDKCDVRQKNRAFCYFCGAIQRLPQCAQCSKTKCMQTTGDCLVPHSSPAVGTALVGAICDFCEAWVCHSKKCITKHTCPCPLDGAVCFECNRGVWAHGGLIYKCGTCRNWLCGDEQMEHQASCEQLQSEDFKCYACNKVGSYSCMACKVNYCTNHVAGKVIGISKESNYNCRKCRQPLHNCEDLSLSVRKHEFGRKTFDTLPDDAFDAKEEAWDLTESFDE